MSRLRPLLAWLVTTLLVPVAVIAQNATITGSVKSETQAPVRGAFVSIPSLNQSTVTNEVGFFRLTLPGTQVGNTVVLRVTSIGFKDVERQITVRQGAANYEITMPEQAISLNEVIVTGTVGRQERRAQAAQVATISAAKVAEVAPVTSVANLLQARTPGVVLRNNSGSSGTSSTIRIRGQASITLSTEPLVFIDGIRAQSGDRQIYGVGAQSGSYLNDIKVEEIESIEIVKGPAAATLYGSDANAGVINIITKRGRQGSGFTQTISMEYGQSDPAFTPPQNYGRCTAGINLTTFPACSGVAAGTVLNDNPLVREQAFGDGRYRNFSWNLRGGGEKYSAFVALGADDDNGTLPNNEYGHVSGRANFDFFASEKVRLEFGVGLNRTTTQLPINDNNIYGYLGGGLLGDPRTVGAAKDGWYAPNRQALAISSNENKDKTLRVQPRFSVNYSPSSWFSNRLTFGGDLARIRAYSFWAKNDDTWFDTPQLNGGQISETRRAIDRLTLDYIGNFTRNLFPELRADVSFGTQVLTRKQDTVDASGTGLINNDVRTVNSTAQLLSGGQNSSEDRTLGAFGQVQFSWKERLYFKVGGRADRSSSFGADSKAFYSPNVGVSYVISDEEFFRNLVPESFLNTLRLRAAWGVTGRAPTSGQRSTFSPTTNQITATTVGIGVNPSATGNPSLKAEKGEEIEVGFEAGLLQDRLGFDVTYFHKKGLDQILSFPSPGSVGASSPDVNVGEILNKGLEMVVTGRPITHPNFALELRAGVNTLHNEVIDLGGTPESSTRKKGFPLSGVWDYRIKRVDVANNLTIVSDTLEFIGNNTNLPGWEGTGTVTLTVFKNLTLYAQADGRGDRIVFDNTSQFRDRQNGGVGGALPVLGCAAFMPNHDTNCTDEAKEKFMRKFGCINPCKTDATGATIYWQKENGQRLAQGDVRGDYNEDGSFIKLREASASYRVPRSLLQRISFAQAASVTLTMRNIKTWTDFTGLDPESDQFLTVPQDRRWITRFNFTF
jgi:TonB-linked SusC/RagA family outer membrane protein